MSERTQKLKLRLHPTDLKRFQSGQENHLLLYNVTVDPLSEMLDVFLEVNLPPKETTINEDQFDELYNQAFNSSTDNGFKEELKQLLFRK